jgi:hypothetical protein
MSLSAATFKDKMDKLEDSQQSIEHASSWCCLYRTEARRLVGHWEDCFSKGDQAKRLRMVYLANDVIQNRSVRSSFLRAVHGLESSCWIPPLMYIAPTRPKCRNLFNSVPNPLFHAKCSRRKGPEFITEFYRILPRALRHMLARSDEATKARVDKVIHVWEDRKVFGTSGAKTLHQLIEEADTEASPAQERTKKRPAPEVTGACEAGMNSQAVAAAMDAAAEAGRAAKEAEAEIAGPTFQDDDLEVLQTVLESLKVEEGTRRTAAKLLRAAAREQDDAIESNRAKQDLIAIRVEHISPQNPHLQQSQGYDEQEAMQRARDALRQRLPATGAGDAPPAALAGDEEYDPEAWG